MNVNHNGERICETRGSGKTTRQVDHAIQKLIESENVLFVVSNENLRIQIERIFIDRLMLLNVEQYNGLTLNRFQISYKNRILWIKTYKDLEYFIPGRNMSNILVIFDHHVYESEISILSYDNKKLKEKNKKSEDHIFALKDEIKNLNRRIKSQKEKVIELMKRPFGGIPGWICPKCGKGISPFNNVCNCN